MNLYKTDALHLPQFVAECFFYQNSNNLVRKFFGRHYFNQFCLINENRPLFIWFKEKQKQAKKSIRSKIRTVLHCSIWITLILYVKRKYQTKADFFVASIQYFHRWKNKIICMWWIFSIDRLFWLACELIEILCRPKNVAALLNCFEFIP